MVQFSHANLTFQDIKNQLLNTYPFLNKKNNYPDGVYVLYS